ncbi:aldose-1-epimerase [Schaalia suimastitidis]|uniref:aldose-1-epimerase n=1 Tax=Schaalia suimastitidis TaxID=121163 RepID=UPI00041535E6|nr:aldose-1-epimerase [Schaalia suimastitidis]
MAPSVSGTEIVLTSGLYSARIVTVGAGIAGLKLKGVDLIHPHSVDELPQGYLGKTLVPWPNRIANGAYTWNGVQYAVPINEPETGTALHGLMCWQDWQIVHADRDSVTLSSFVAPRYGYPWPLQTSVTYALHGETGLSVTITTKNIGTQTAPYGSSSHPYLTLGMRPVDAYELTLPASQVALVDESMIPTTCVEVEEAQMDYRLPRLIGAQSIDNAFTSLPQGPWTVRLAHGESWVELESDARWVQLYTGERVGRQSVAVEPMPCAPNAFNSGDGLVELAPGTSHTLRFTVRGHIV